jgi:succinate dehydrogenase / fumarate reductase flavoprotein subunit
VKLYTRSEMLDLVMVDGVARGIVTTTSSPAGGNHAAHAVVLATGGYDVFYLQA